MAQLTQRTNQMNATLRAAHGGRDPGALRRAECLTVRRERPLRRLRPDRRDDFPPRRGDALVVDTFLLSCRALGRGVEHRMVARLGEIALERGLARVEIPFVRAPAQPPGGAVSGIDRRRRRIARAGAAAARAIPAGAMRRAAV